MVKELSVSRLNAYIKGVFEDELVLQNIAVYGEISECRIIGGNTYFTLRDDTAAIEGVIFSRREDLSAGQTVSVRGSVTFYPKGGKVSFKAYEISLRGKGDLSLKLEQLKKKLYEEGVFSSRPPLPAFVGKVAVITSGSGAVIHDIKNTLYKRHGYIALTLFDVRVQGEGAEKGIAAALKEADLQKFDLIILARGGGSEDDLSVFNTENLARVLSQCKTPSISAIGHEINFTLCDFAASARAGTPSIAADTVARINETAFAEMFSVCGRIKSAAAKLFTKKLNSVAALSGRVSAAAMRLYKDGFYSVKAVSYRIAESIAENLDKKRNGLKTVSAKTVDLSDRLLLAKQTDFKENAARLNSLSPLSAFERGYSKVLKNGGAVTSVKNIAEGDNIKIIFKDGEAGAEIKSASEFIKK